MQNWPKISLVTPSFNQAKFIEQTIQSVLQQKYPNLEYLVIDGGSTDGTLKILKKYQKQLKFISEPDFGQSNAINKGLKMASGNIVGYINSDDRLLPNALKSVAQKFVDYPEIKWLTGKCRIIDEKGQEILTTVTAYKNFWLQRYTFTALTILNFISQPATFWRKELLWDKDIGYLDEKLDYSMDYDYWLKLGKKYRPYITSDYLAEYRMHISSKGGGNPGKQFRQEYLLSLKYLQNPLWQLVHYLHAQVANIAYNVFRKL